jgi:hypothetical protein
MMFRKIIILFFFKNQLKLTNSQQVKCWADIKSSGSSLTPKLWWVLNYIYCPGQGGFKFTVQFHSWLCSKLRLAVPRELQGLYSAQVGIESWKR